jgi:hypothetical protein
LSAIENSIVDKGAQTSRALYDAIVLCHPEMAFQLFDFIIATRNGFHLHFDTNVGKS